MEEVAILFFKRYLRAAIDSGDNLPPPPLFICPQMRLRVSEDVENRILRILGVYRVQAPGYDVFRTIKISHLDGKYGETWPEHEVLPLFWCNNKEADPNNDCSICKIQKVGTHYYLCVTCDKRFHKECVESPLEINYPSHVKHSLQLYYSKKTSDHCILCTKKADAMLYYCALCDIYMHPLCAQAAIPFFIDQPKRHDHTLTLFPRQASLTCNVCGLVDKLHFTYVCRSICDFVTHSDCIHIPQIIRISRHFHRVSFASSLPLGKWFCGVCRREIDSDFGAYTCNVCRGYAVHTRCALRNDIWDGIELEGVPEDKEVEPPFRRIADGIILHFSHGCHMEFDTNGVYKENKFCQACVLPINEENVYVCMECDFILHETCAEAPRKKVHPLHPHPLEQKFVHEEFLFECGACKRKSNGCGYVCTIQGCDFMLDAVCASASEPFSYPGHQHPLFLASDPKEETMCHICKSTGVQKVLNCIEIQCSFIICFKCATLPYKVKYKYDEHYLTFCHGIEASGLDWCELCEGNLAIGGEKGFYNCNDCCTTVHINCLLGPDPYMKLAPTYTVDGLEVLLRRNNSASRPFCNRCNIRCPYPTVLELIYEMSSTFLCCISSHNS